MLKSCTQKQQPAAIIHQQVKNDAAALQSCYEKEWNPLLQKGSKKELQASFLNGRQLYKQMEWAIEYFFPATAKDINGSAVPEIEGEENLVFPPSGFGVMETFLFPFDEASRAALQQESKKLESVLFRLQTLWTGHQFRTDQVWDAARLQLLRISALGLSNFDTPLYFTSLQEIRFSIQGIARALIVYDSNGAADFKMFKNAFVDANAYVQHQHFDLFDRMHFIQQHLQPLGRQLVTLQKRLHIPFNDIHALRGNAATFFDTAVFNPDFFTLGKSSYINDSKISLGRQLFGDAILLGNGVSCASCHHANKAFTDGLPKSRSFGVDSFLQRNTPTLWYAGLQQSQFYDMRAPHLEDQVKNVVDNKDEMHGSLGAAVQKIKAQHAYVKMFQKAFNDTATGITQYQVQAALAAYVRSLAPFTSHFDRHMRGNKELNRDEIKGFNLFMGKAKCGSCHFMPLFNGTVPPTFYRTESEVIGVPDNVQFSKLSTDMGRYNIRQL